MKLQQIVFFKQNTDNDYVTFENGLSPRIKFESPEHIKKFNDRKDDIIADVEKRIEEYIDTPELCNDDEEMFPQPKCMTGEWYIASITGGEDWLSIETAFIGVYMGKKCDYLGLEVWYHMNELNEWLFDGINSSAI